MPVKWHFQNAGYNNKIPTVKIHKNIIVLASHSSQEIVDPFKKTENVWIRWVSFGSDQQKLQLNIQIICAARGALTSVLRYKTASPKAPLPRVLILV